MNARIDGCIDWSLQAEDFAWDGSLRDIYVQETSLEDWQRVLRLIQQGPYAAEFFAEDSPQPFPDDVHVLFRDPSTRPGRLWFSVGGVHLACHFFRPEEIEFDLDPREVTEATLPGLLRFMADLGDATGHTVVLTPENCREAPVFRYDAALRQMAWVP
jgi:hypothetical protein